MRVHFCRTVLLRNAARLRAHGDEYINWSRVTLLVGVNLKTRKDVLSDVERRVRDKCVS